MDAGEVPRELHRAAATQGFLGPGVPEEKGGSGGTFLDALALALALALTEATAEAGASSGLLAALFTSGIAHRSAQRPDRPAAGLHRMSADIVARPNWRKAHGTSYEPVAMTTGGYDVRGYAEPDKDADELLDLIPTDLKEPFDPREVIERICDGVSETNGVVFDEFKPLYGPSLVTGWAKVHAHQVGILANAQGELFSEESQKAAALYDAGDDTGAGEAANMAKYAAAEAACDAADRAVQARGGNGITQEYGVAGLLVVAWVGRIAPVSREMILNCVGMHSLGLPKSY